MQILQPILVIFSEMSELIIEYFILYILLYTHEYELLVAHTPPKK